MAGSCPSSPNASVKRRAIAMVFWEGGAAGSYCDQPRCGDGSTKASCVDFFFGWHGIARLVLDSVFGDDDGVFVSFFDHRAQSHVKSIRKAILSTQNQCEYDRFSVGQIAPGFPNYV